MDVRIRPPRIRRQDSPVRGWILAAVLCGCTGIVILGSATAKQSAIDPATETEEATAELDIPSAGQFISIHKVPAGSEALNLSARLTEKSLNPIDGVTWIIRNASGEVVFSGQAMSLTDHFAPGDYLVEATYGLAKIKEQITLPKSNSMDIGFVMNVGGLRVLPSVKDIANSAVPSVSNIYALEGTLRGRLIASSRVLGEVLFVSAGSYRIESSFDQGNAQAVTDVDVKPGKMSAIEIAHLAGLVTIKSEAGSTWAVQSADGHNVAELSAVSSTLVLKPGKYVAVTQAALLNKSVGFEVLPGQQIEISLTR